MRNCVGRTPSKEDGDRPGEPPRRLPKFQDYRETVYAEAEKHYLHDLMSLAEESIPEACRLSGLSQSRLYALLKKHRIERRDPLRNPPDTDCLPEENTPYPHRS
jgi:two-component system NtrC family response regulator